MKSETYFCDRCKKIVSESELTNIFLRNFLLGEIKTELCKSCRNDFFDFIKDKFIEHQT